jgi:transposase
MKTNDPKTDPPYAAFVGLDWADRSHHVCLRAAGSERDEHRELAQDPLALQTWAHALAARFPHGKIAVALEQSKGPLIYALLRHAHLELFPLNPAMLAKYREAATAASGVKDDPLDARLACELLRVHRDWLRPLSLLPAEVRELQMLLEARRGLVEQRTSGCEQLGAALKGYYPQALELAGGELSAPLGCAFLRRWPTLAAVQRARTDTLRRFYHQHGVRSAERIAERLALVRTAVPLTNDAAVLAALPVLVGAVVAQLEVLHRTIADYDRRIADLFARQADAALFATFPGAGPQLAPRLLVAFGPDRGRYQAAAEIQCYSGIAPVKKKSGDGLDITQWRWHCPKFLRQTFHEFAGCSIPQSQWAQAYYQQQIKRGKSPNKAKRALAYKWQRVLYRCWQTGEPYDEKRYIAALRHRGSPLVELIDALATAA